LLLCGNVFFSANGTAQYLYTAENYAFVFEVNFKFFVPNKAKRAHVSSSFEVFTVFIAAHFEASTAVYPDAALLISASVNMQRLKNVA
jgi:hypothetical protein